MSQTATATIGDGGLTRGAVARAKVGSLIQRQGALIALIIVFIFAAIRYPNFLTADNLLNVLLQNSFVGLVALGMTFVILAGGIDLSVGSLLAVAGVLAANLSGQGMLIALLVPVLLTVLLGAMNGFIIARAHIPPFIVTLAMMIAARGIALIATGEQSVRVERSSQWFTWLGRGLVGPVPVPIIIFIVVFLFLLLVLNYTRFGRHVYSIGDNEEAARLMGLNVGRVTIGVYALSGALAGLAGVALAARLGTGQPVAGIGIELDAIAAVVVGGTLLTGGQGGLGSTVIGVLLLAVILNVIKTENISPWWQEIVRGGFLLAVVIVQNRLSQRK